jgi:hypothetical protein
MFMAAIMYILLSLLGSLAFFLQILIVSMCGVSFYFILNYVLKSEPLFYMLTLIKDRKL